MRKGSRFLIGLAAAGLTFGTLTATLGPKHFNRHYGPHHCGGYWNHHHDNCEEQEPAPVANPAETK
ncbi:MAG: hypothetical protein ACXVP0_11475 [Bacteroidia bacterium]